MTFSIYIVWTTRQKSWYVVYMCRVCACVCVCVCEEICVPVKNYNSSVVIKGGQSLRHPHRHISPDPYFKGCSEQYPEIMAKHSLFQILH